MGFLYTGNSKNNFYGPGGSHLGPGGFWLILGLEKATFDQFSMKMYVFPLLKICLLPVILRNIIEPQIKALTKVLTLQNCQKGCLKALKMLFIGKKGLPSEMSGLK